MKKLAEYLRSERLDRGMALKSVSEKTSLSLDILTCMEEGKFEQIETPLLIRSFLRAYCRVLQIDSQPLLKRHCDSILACDRQKECIRRYGKISRSLRVKRRPGMFSLLLLGIAAFGTVYWAALFYKWKGQMTDSQLMNRSIPQQEFPADLPNGDSTPPSAEAGNDPNPASSEAGELNSTAGGTRFIYEGKQDFAPAGLAGSGCDTGNLSSEILPEDTPTPPPEGSKHHFRVTASRKVELTLAIDNDKSKKTFVLKSGETRTWEAGEFVEIASKDANAIRLEWDGKAVAPPGKQTRSLHMRIPPLGKNELSGKKRH